MTCDRNKLYYYDVLRPLILMERGLNSNVFSGGHVLRVMRWTIPADVLWPRVPWPELLMVSKHRPDTFLPKGEL